uniref:GPN-loop GTPase 2 n=1 Tax=Panagrellus redivivus TaxID=6233 RepID=A0A7E4UW17_PANRE
MVFYGQLVVGAPGAGKSTYCSGLVQLLKQLKRPVICVNLDPANDVIPFDCDVDIRELVTVEDAMETFNLGPNGALRYCMQTLLKNIGWLKHKITSLAKEASYLVIDMPGQLELYNSDDSITQIIQQFNKWDWRMCAVHLSDSVYIADPGKFVSVILAALSIMVNLEVAQINVLTKVDLLDEDRLPYDFEFFENLPDLKYLTDLLDDHPFLSQYKNLSSKLCEIVDSYSLVGFVPLNVKSKERMLHLLKQADKANGFELIDSKDLRGVIVAS